MRYSQKPRFNSRYNPNKEIRIKTLILRSDLWNNFDLWNNCDFSNAYIVVRGTITANKKTLIFDDFEAPNNTATNATATNTANNNAFCGKSWLLKIMHYLLIASHKLMV